MNYQDFLDIKEEVKEALKNNMPIVALESTILSHGMPYPENVKFAGEVEKVVRECGAIPATIAIINGRIKIGLTDKELEIMCKAKENNVGKVSRRDMAWYIANPNSVGATTVASTMICAHMAGIKVFATGGIGGVHRNGENTMDISADLQELGNTPVAVVCAGAKQILDIGRTLEYLETMGVPVLGLNTDHFPAFFCPDSGFGVDYNCKTPKDAAKVIKASHDLGFKGGILIGNPVPIEYAQDYNYMEGIITQALKMADEKGIHGKNITPFLLATIKELTGGESFKSNVELALNNARQAAKIAFELSNL